MIPKYLFGRPIDAMVRTPPWLPLWPQRLLGSLLVRLAVGRMENYGLPQPQHRMWQTHPTVSSEFLIRAGSGDITVKPNIVELAGDIVRFADGTRSRSTRSSMPRATRSRSPSSTPGSSHDDNHFPLFKRAFMPGVPNLIFVGFAQAVPSIIKFVEIQTRWLAAYVAGQYALPRSTRCSASSTTTSMPPTPISCQQAPHDAGRHPDVCAGSEPRVAARRPACRRHEPRYAKLARLRSMNAIVTGAASGIGCRLVTLLAQAGHLVIAADIDVDGCESRRAHVTGRPMRSSIRHSTSHCRRLVGADGRGRGARFGRLDWLFNVAGVLRIEPFTKLRPKASPCRST